ncbi:MAG: GatB/YqeY domain-containing protein [Patescibacteria group bacterium]
MSLQEQIKGEIKTAMMAKDTVKLTVVRGLATAFMNELVATKRTPQDSLTDEEASAVIRRSIKQRKDSIEQFTAANRPDLAENEQAELAILETYLPKMMSQDEIRPIAEAKKAELGITDKSKMGMLMNAVMKDLKGKADGGDVKVVVESLL